MSAVALHGSQRRTMVGVVLAFAAISAIFGLWQIMEGADSALYLYRITNEGEAVGFFANRNHLAGLLAASLPVAAGMLADRLRHHPHGIRDLRVWMLTALIVLLAVSATATHSRAGFGLLMVSVLASAAVLLRARPQGPWAGARPWLRVSALIAGLLIVQFTLYGLLVRLESDPLDDHRWTLAANTLQAAEPARGTGFGTRHVRVCVRRDRRPERRHGTVCEPRAQRLCRTLARGRPAGAGAGRGRTCDDRLAVAQVPAQSR